MRYITPVNFHDERTKIAVHRYCYERQNFYPVSATYDRTKDVLRFTGSTAGNGGVAKVKYKLVQVPFASEGHGAYIRDKNLKRKERERENVKILTALKNLEMMRSPGLAQMQRYARGKTKMKLKFSYLW